MQKVFLAAAVMVGLALTYFDSRPGWDDTGITAGLVLIFSAIAGALMPQRPWMAALCVGLWIPALGVLVTRNYASFLALAIAFVGAYGGAFIRGIASPGGLTSRS